MSLPKQVTLVEVSPRDGLQNESVFIPTDVKIQFIEQLAQSGLKHIELTSLVSPQWYLHLYSLLLLLRLRQCHPFCVVSYRQYPILLKIMQPH